MTFKHSQSGQILLVVVLIATVLLTIGLSVSKVTTQETRISKLEQDSKKAFAAAEAGLEAALHLQSGSIPLSTVLGEDAGISGQAEIITTDAPTYNTPQLKKDDQLTFYLSGYTPAEPGNPDSQGSFDVPFPGNLKIHIDDEASFCNDTKKHALELTFVNATEPSNKITLRKIIELRNCDPAVVEGTRDKINYDDILDLTSSPSHLLFVRLIASSSDFPGLRVQVVNTTGDGSQNWPTQGKTIISTATTTDTNVSKKIKLFQSYPQLPADFFITSF